MNRTDIEVLLKQDDVLLLEIFRRAKTQMTVECESIPIDNNASKESASPHKFVDLSRNSLTHYNSIESTKKKQLAFRKEEVSLK